MVEHLGPQGAQSLASTSAPHPSVSPLDGYSLAAKVSEADACALMSAVWEEFSRLPGSVSLPSSPIIQRAHRLRVTGHENRLSTTLEEAGLAAPVPISYVDVEAKKPHPVLRTRDFVSTLSEQGKLDLLFCGHQPEDFTRFWTNYRQHDSTHPVYSCGSKLRNILPIYLHLDEGTSQKEKQLCHQLQPLLGRGSSKGSSDLNFLGNSLTTRMLFSVMMAGTYNGPLKKNRPLHALIEHFCLDLRSCFDEPIEIKFAGKRRRIRLAPVGLKGDWPAIVKAGRLIRHHSKQTKKKEFGDGNLPLVLGWPAKSDVARRELRQHACHARKCHCSMESSKRACFHQDSSSEPVSRPSGGLL